MTVTKLGDDIEGSSGVISLGYEERKSHIECIGRTGSGKTTFLTNVFLQDIMQGKGGAYFDPDGDAVHAILNRLPATKLQNVFWLDPNDDTFPGINPLYCADVTDPKQVTDVASSTLHIFKQIWTNISPEHTPRLEIILQLCFITLILNKKTLADLPALLSDEKVRQEMVLHIPDTYEYKHVRDFWLKEFKEWDQKTKDARTESTKSRILEFLINPYIKKIIDHQKTGIDFKTAMDKGHVFLIRLSPYREGVAGGIGEEGSQLIGTMLVSLILKAAMTRATRNFFSLVVDEFELFASPDFTDMLARVRKYGVAVTIGYQYRGQLDDKLRGAVEQTSAKVVCRTTATDAKHFASTFAKDVPPAETRTVPKLAPRRDLLEWFQRGNEHPNKRVMELVNMHVWPLKHRVGFTDPFNRFFAQAMAGEFIPFSEIENQRKLLRSLPGDLGKLIEEEEAQCIVKYASASPTGSLSLRETPYLPVSRETKEKIRELEEKMNEELSLIKIKRECWRAGVIVANRIEHSFTEPLINGYQGKGMFDPKAVKVFEDNLYRVFLEQVFQLVWMDTKTYTNFEEEYTARFPHLFPKREELLRSEAKYELERPERIRQLESFARYVDKYEKNASEYIAKSIAETKSKYWSEHFERDHIRAELEKQHKLLRDAYLSSRNTKLAEGLKITAASVITDPFWLDVHTKAIKLVKEIEDALITHTRSFIPVWEELVQLLSQPENKILAPSEHYEEQPVHQKSPQDMEAEMEKELMRLERGTAWCQFEDYNAPSGQQNKRYKIQIPKDLYPEAVYGKVATKRFEAIRQKTSATYCKDEPRPTIVPKAAGASAIPDEATWQLIQEIGILEEKILDGIATKEDIGQFKQKREQAKKNPLIKAHAQDILSQQPANDEEVKRVNRAFVERIGELEEKYENLVAKKPEEPQEQNVLRPLQRRYPVKPQPVQPTAASDVLSPTELQRRYKDYLHDMTDMGRKPLSREAWEKLELAKYAAEN